MNQGIIIAAVLALSAVSAGCTSMQTVDSSGRPLAEVLRPGDHVIVYEDSGRILDIRFVRIDGEVLRGSLFADGLEPVAVDLARIDKVTVERISVGKTGLAVVGGVVLAPIAALGMGAALADEMQ